MQNKLCDLLTV